MFPENDNFENVFFHNKSIFFHSLVYVYLQPIITSGIGTMKCLIIVQSSEFIYYLGTEKRRKKCEEKYRKGKKLYAE